MKKTFKENLYGLFKKDARLWDKKTKELNETLLKDLIDKLDEKLIELLFSDKQTKEKFFIKIKDVFVLKQNELKFFIDENKLNNSYTQYQNKIGLRVGNKLLSERNEVVLDWPFKDCVLEGGMTKEDQKRNEIFFNEVLAKDEIDRLEDPKAFVNWKRYTAKGEEKVKELKRGKDGTIKENLIVKGNNLLALHSLKEQFAGKVKLIYIDPPYNTGNDEFKYNDNFNHSTWLTFMRNRLEVARELLRDDGVIFVQIDSNERDYLKILMDEIFERDNYLNNVVIRKKQAAGVGQDAFLLDTVEYLLMYAKDKNSFSRQTEKQYIEVPITEKVMKNYSSILESLGIREFVKTITDPRGNKIKIYKYPNAKISNINKKQYKVDFYLKNREKIFVTYGPQSSLMRAVIKSLPSQDFYEIEYVPIRGRNEGKLTKVNFYNKRIISWLRNLTIVEGQKLLKKRVAENIWTDISWDTISLEGDVMLKSGKKPEPLLQRLIKITTKPVDIVLDFFMGTGTTCAVAHKMGRQYIGIEQLDYGKNDSVVRLKNVINGDTSGISKSVNWQGGGDFVYLELAKWNEEAKEKILKAKNLKELEKFFDELYERYFLDYNVKAKEFKEKILKEEGFKKLSLNEQKKLFVEMLDMNQMYVNFSERADKKYNLSKNDISLSEEFYNEKNKYA